MPRRTPRDLDGRLVASITDVAALLETDPRTVLRGIEAGDIPAVKVGRVWRIPVPKLKAMLGLADEPTTPAA